MKIEWNKGYKFSDPEYKKYFKQAWIVFLSVLLIGAIILAVWNQEINTADQLWVIFIVIWAFILGYAISAANTIEAIDHYQTKKDKKNDKIPTL